MLVTLQMDKKSKVETLKFKRENVVPVGGNVSTLPRFLSTHMMCTCGYTLRG